MFSADDCSESGSDGSGVDASFVLYVSAVTSGSCPVSAGSGTTLAYAGSCELEDQYDRSVCTIALVFLAKNNGTCSYFIVQFQRN